MKRFLLLTTFENERDGHLWVEYKMFEDECDAKNEKRLRIDESASSAIKVKSSVVLKVKEVG